MKKICIVLVCLMALACLCSCGGNKACTTCADANNDHKCDVCEQVTGTCKDENKDHNCDICKKALSECADANSDHKCDTCATELSQCADADNNNLCDVCGKAYAPTDNKRPVVLPTIPVPLG
jgi:hypothetical protein